MNETAIEMILQKLGTTIENIIPAAISYGMQQCKIEFASGLLILVASLLAAKTTKNLKDDDLALIILIVSGFIAILGIGVCIISLVNIHLWIKFPEVSSYRMILGWFNG